MRLPFILLLSLVFVTLSCSKEESETTTETTTTTTPTNSGNGGGTQATCTDGIQNGNETGIDCGGDCPDCPGSGNSFQGYAKLIADGITSEIYYDETDWDFRSRRDLNVKFPHNGSDPCWGIRLHGNSVHSDYQDYFDGNAQGVITLELWHPGVDTEPTGNTHVTLLFTGIGDCTPTSPYCLGSDNFGTANNCLTFLSIAEGGDLELDFRADAVYCRLTGDVQFWCAGEGGAFNTVYPCEQNVTHLEWMMFYQ